MLTIFKMYTHAKVAAEDEGEVIPKDQFDRGFVGPFSGKILKVIYKALPVLENEGLKLENYDVTVIDGEKYYVIHFRDSKLGPLVVGGGSIEVELNKKTLATEVKRIGTK